LTLSIVKIIPSRGLIPGGRDIVGMTVSRAMKNGFCPASAACGTEAASCAVNAPALMLSLDAIVLASIFVALAVLLAVFCGAVLLLPLLALLIIGALPLRAGPTRYLEEL